jgi:hypothetical protein
MCEKYAIENGNKLTQLLINDIIEGDFGLNTERHMASKTAQKVFNSTNTERLLLLLVIVWIVTITIFAQLMEWVMEQTLFESTILFPDMRWLIHLAYTVLVSLPVFMVSFIAQAPRMKILFKFWAIIASLGYFLTVGRFSALSQTMRVSLFQTLGISLFFILLVVFQKQSFKFLISLFKEEKGSLGLIFGLGALVSIPWVLCGSLGSIADSALNLISSLVLSIFYVYAYLVFFYRKIAENNETAKPNSAFNGLVIFISLLILSTVFGQTGQQWLLIFTIPFSSWMLSNLFEFPQNSPKIYSGVVFLFILVSLPLCWFDPDELSLLLGSQKGEILTWVNQAVLYSVLILVLLTGVYRMLSKNPPPKLWRKVLYPCLWAIPVCLYIFLGKPGFFGESYILVLDQDPRVAVIDFSEEQSPRETVFLELSGFAQKSQADLVRVLDRWGIEYQSYYLVNAIEVKSGPILRYYLSQWEEVDRILESPNLRPLPKPLPEISGEAADTSADLWNLTLIGADQVWEEFGLNGEGIVIGLADTGMAGEHAELKEQYLGFSSGDDYHWLDPWNQSASPTDLNGHGTHTLGVILGTKTGVAPGANWIGCVNLGRNFGNPGLYLECMQFLFAPYPQGGDPIWDGEPALGADIINNSWGCSVLEGCDESFLSSAVSALRAAGVFLSVANGNEGYYGCNSTVSPLAIYEEVFSVGAIDSSGELADFSSLGPTSESTGSEMKPDLVAPGVDIYSTLPNNSHGSMSGTSSAAAHVAGVVALMWSANPELRGNIDLTEKILFETADPYKGVLPACVDNLSPRNNAVGYGILNALKAVEASLNLK